MPRVTVTIVLIFSLFLLSHARIQPNDPEDQNQLVEWKTSISNDLPNDLIDSETDPKILLPTQKPLEDDVVVSEEISEFESSTGNAEELPESETTISSIDDEDLEDDKKHEKHKKHKKHGFFYHLFHKHCHHHHHHRKNDTKHEKRGFLFHFFHKHCHKHHHHHHHKNDTKDEGMEKVTEKQIELRNAGEEIPDEDHMIKRFKPRKGGFLHGKRVHPRYSQVEDGEGKIRFEEGMSKLQHKEWKKEKKHHKEGKKEKKHRGLIKWFKKLFKHF